MALTSYYASIGGNNYYDYYIFFNSIILFYFFKINEINLNKCLKIHIYAKKTNQFLLSLSIYCLLIKSVNKEYDLKFDEVHFGLILR